MGNKRQLGVYILLAVGWVTICAWQGIEHKRAAEARRQALLDRSDTMSRAMGAIIRTASQFPVNVFSRNWMEAALKDLIEKPSEVLSISLLNKEGSVVASAGTPPFEDLGNLKVDETLWGPKTLAVVNVVDLGRAEFGPDMSRKALVVDQPQFGPPPGRNDENTSGTQKRWDRPNDERTSGTERNRPGGRRDQGPGGPPPDFRSPEGEPPPPPPQSADTGDSQKGERRDGRREESRAGWKHEGAPPRWAWWGGRSHEEFEKIVRDKGLHRFVIFMSTEDLDKEIGSDLQMRLIVCVFTLVASLGLGSAWRGVERSTELNLRLARARQANVYLREKNVAAAGLAHETRNPLNIVRGLAQMISKSPEASATIRQKTTELIEEVDRVTSRLNEFIDYSKPREPKPIPTDLNALVRDVERMLESDFEDKHIQFTSEMPPLTIQADEALLRQVIFNLLINSAQAVSNEGHIAVVGWADKEKQVFIEVRDDGPGVPSENREEIFRPYFTTSAQGTGLGLAVVWQICLAHEWEIAYVDSERGGATFRISGMKLAETA
ncbi:MAG TPA: ATP-binding protein [Candidatus Sumerlaeota bacterium]|nr:ATP-binding protein [Candidatus Sumerlaeota bacterium]